MRNIFFEQKNKENNFFTIFLILKIKSDCSVSKNFILFLRFFMIIILLLCCLSLTARAYNLLKTIEISANNNKIYGVLNMEKSDANLLLVFYFENASYPLALVSEYEITDRDFNRTVKPIFIESKKPIFFDYESIQTHSSKHYIEIPYMESVYYFAKDGFGYFKLKIEVYSKPQSTCTNNC